MVDTKLEAYKLVHDPVHLISLLYSKYVDIEEDYGLLISNQLIFNRQSHLNIYYKEQKLFYKNEEYFRRFYKKNESKSRILRLNEYYKNYQSFFCKATFTDFVFGTLLKNYQDTKAEIFYKNNYGDSFSKKEENSKSLNYNITPSLSSLDNITYNDTIFDKKNKQIIENEDKNFTITLTSDSFRKHNNLIKSTENLVSTNENEESFVQCLKNIVYYKEKKKKYVLDNKNKNEKVKKENKEIKTGKEKDLKKLCKQVNDKIKKKFNNCEKIFLEKSSKDNNYNNSKNLLSVLNLGNSINSATNKNNKNISKENIKSSSGKNLFLSPQKNILFFPNNITSRISQFKKQTPINIKYLNRNKSSHHNKRKNNQIILNKLSQNSKNTTYFLLNNKENEFNLNKLDNISVTQLRNFAGGKIENKIIKPNISEISKYNQFLIANKNNRNKIKNLKNKTYELINNENKMKILRNQKLLLNHYKKMAQSPKIYKNDLVYNKDFKSKYRLFKGGNLSPDSFSSINRQKNINRRFNKKYFISSNSIDNNIHISSFSPKSISTNLNINKEKTRNIGVNKNTNNTFIQNNINIINKIKIQPKQNKNNSNYNINFNNLFFYGANTPANCFENFRNNIINNKNKNVNINKINTNFYMLSFNNCNDNSVDVNSRNKNKHFNSSLNKKEIKTQNNTKYMNIKNNETEKRYKSFKKHEFNLNQNSHLPVNKICNIKNVFKRKSKEKIKSLK